MVDQAEGAAAREPGVWGKFPSARAGILARGMGCIALDMAAMGAGGVFEIGVRAAGGAGGAGGAR